MKPLSRIHLLLMNFDLDANKHTEKSLIQIFHFPSCFIVVDKQYMAVE